MGEIPPIDVGAKFQVNDAICRVVNIWIDEDGFSQLTLRWLEVPFENDRPDESVDYETFRQMCAESKIERTNDGHDAWKWRNR